MYKKYYNYSAYFIITLLIFSFLPQCIYSSKNNKKKHTKKIYKKDHSVIILTDINFEKVISSKDILVLFYKDDDKNCQQFLPTYTQASLTLRNYKTHSNFGRIECNTYSKICEKQNCMLY